MCCLEVPMKEGNMFCLKVPMKDGNICCLEVPMKEGNICCLKGAIAMLSSDILPMFPGTFGR